VFDPANSKIQQPNDLAFQALPRLQGAAKELVQMFFAAGGFPSDQDTPIAVDLQHQTLPTAAGPGPTSAPQLDITKVALPERQLQRGGVREDRQRRLADDAPAALRCRLCDRARPRHPVHPQ
jgi:hypothetical protein